MLALLNGEVHECSSVMVSEGRHFRGRTCSILSATRSSWSILSAFRCCTRLRSHFLILCTAFLDLTPLPFKTTLRSHSLILRTAFLDLTPLPFKTTLRSNFLIFASKECASLCLFNNPSRVYCCTLDKASFEDISLQRHTGFPVGSSLVSAFKKRPSRIIVIITQRSSSTFIASLSSKLACRDSTQSRSNRSLHN